jgi:hypothetical protein
MKSKREERIEIGYAEYLKLPLATVSDVQSNEIYSNRWFFRTGRSIVSPHPHRHYTLVEFAFECGYNSTLYDRFVMPLIELARSEPCVCGERTKAECFEECIKLTRRI